MIKDGKLDSKVIGMGLATLGLFVTLVLTLPILMGLYFGSVFDSETANILLFVSAPAFMLFILGIRMTARVSERFLGLVCIGLGAPFIAIAVEFLINPSFFSPNSEFDPLSSLFIGTSIAGIGLSKLTGMGDKGAVIPPTEGMSVNAGAFDFMKVFDSVLFLGLVLPALVVGLLLLGGFVSLRFF